MGSKRRAQLLRMAVCVVVILAIALYFAPKACWPPGCHRAVNGVSVDCKVSWPP